MLQNNLAQWIYGRRLLLMQAQQAQLRKRREQANPNVFSKIDSANKRALRARKR